MIAPVDLAGLTCWVLDADGALCQAVEKVSGIRDPEQAFVRLSTLLAAMPAPAALPHRDRTAIRKHVGDQAYLEHYFTAVWALVDSLKSRAAAQKEANAPAPATPAASVDTAKIEDLADNWFRSRFTNTAERAKAWAELITYIDADKARAVAAAVAPLKKLIRLTAEQRLHEQRMAAPQQHAQAALSLSGLLRYDLSGDGACFAPNDGSYVVFDDVEALLASHQADSSKKAALSEDEQAQAWQAVAEALDEGAPGWLSGPLSGLDSAVKVIGELCAARMALTDLSIVNAANAYLTTTDYIWTADVDQLWTFARAITSHQPAAAPAVASNPWQKPDGSCKRWCGDGECKEVCVSPAQPEVKP